jgi:exoribonuclease R
MVRVPLRSPRAAARAVIAPGITQIQSELGIAPEFPEDVLSAAVAAARAPRLPTLDRTDIEFVTIDPPTARDLDQALHIAEAGSGFLVHYAIADLAAFITPGDPIDVEAHRRGETLYGADTKIPLHPQVISEDAGSLAPGQVRPALLWSIHVDETGEGTDIHVERALVRSRAQLDYEGAQALIDAGEGSDTLRLLRRVGELREAKERSRGGVSLPLPDQEISVSGDRWDLEYRSPPAVEGWNAQISLLTGLGAAWLMLDAGVGILRVLPPPAERDVARLRRTAHALDIEWPAEQSYAEFVRGLDPAYANQAAMITSCTRLLRGSGYVGFAGSAPPQPRHSALAAPYAHVTAPLRRLVDRYALEICVSICAEVPVPEWVLGQLATLPEVMRESSRRANAYERAVVDLVEAGLLHARVGEEFRAVVVAVDDRDPRRGTVMVRDPAIEAPVSSAAPLPLGADVTVRLSRADLDARKVAFELVSGEPPNGRPSGSAAPGPH